MTEAIPSETGVRISAAGNGQAGRVGQPHDQGDRVGQGLLDGSATGLAGPAGEVGPVVGDVQPQPDHSAGVSPSAGANTSRSMAGLRNPANDSGFIFNGLRGRNNSIAIDGVDNRDETTGGNRVAVGLEMIQEFRVSATSISAELGGAAGGLVNVVTHTGQNLWHGDVTFFHQNEKLNAPEVPVPRTWLVP